MGNLADNQYRLTGPSPAQSGDIIQVGENFFKIVQHEPLYHEARNIAGGSDIGFTTDIFAITELIPSQKFLHYITGFGILGDMKVQIFYQSGAPRFTPGAKSSQKLDRTQAPYDKPFTAKFVVEIGDTLEIDVEPAFQNLKGAIWFYGWKFRIEPMKEESVRKHIRESGIGIIVLEDVRRL